MTAGWTPVAVVDDVEGVEPYEVAQQLSGVPGEDPVFIEELYGGLHLAYWEEEDAKWPVLMELEEDEDDRYLDITDDLAERLGAPDGDYGVVQQANYEANRQVVQKNGE